MGGTAMKKKNYKPLLFIIPVILILLLLLGLYLENRSTIISPIPKDTIGNTAGNLRGEGRFCEYDGKVYFPTPMTEMPCM